MSSLESEKQRPPRPTTEEAQIQLGALVSYGIKKGSNLRSSQQMQLLGAIGEKKAVLRDSLVAAAQNHHSTAETNGQKPSVQEHLATEAIERTRNGLPPLDLEHWKERERELRRLPS